MTQRAPCACNCCPLEGESSQFDAEGYCPFCTVRCFPRQPQGNRLAFTHGARQVLHQGAGAPRADPGQQTEDIAQDLMPLLRRAVRWGLNRWGGGL